MNTTHRARPFSLVVPQGSPEGGVAGSFINIQPGCFQGMPANKPFNEAVRATPHHMAQSSPLLFCPCQNLTTYLGTLFHGKKNIFFQMFFFGSVFPRGSIIFPTTFWSQQNISRLKVFFALEKCFPSGFQIFLAFCIFLYSRNIFSSRPEMNLDIDPR